MNIELNFGALARPIKMQLARQGLIASKEQYALWQRKAEAITVLVIGDTLTEAEAKRARVRLLKTIAKNVRLAP